jgi:hypothetical protein
MTETTAETTAPTTPDPTRYAHFHKGCTHVDKKTGTTHPGKGRLVATVATTELPDGTIAVGVSRVNPGDNPVRYSGRQKARARMDRLVHALMGTPMKSTQSTLLAEERAELLAFRMDRQTFVEKVIKDGIFKRLAQANDDPREVRRLLDELRKNTI